MKKIASFSLIILGLVVLLSGCSIEKSNETKADSKELFYDTDHSPQTEISTSEDTLDSSPSTNTSVVAEIDGESGGEEVSEKEVLNEFANAYYNFQSINDRNKALAKYGTPEMIEENGLAIEVEVAYNSVGFVKGIYQNLDDSAHYSIFCESTVNKVTIQSVLICQITSENKIESFEEQVFKEKY